ncbi:MAG: FixH family protein [Gammaproteobacteria bacterium]
MNEDQTSWYKNPYVWLIIFFPLTAIVAGIITINLAISSDDGLVIDDYYKEGLKINQVLERDNIAQQMDLIATINMEHDTQKVKLLLSANKDFQYPPEIQVTFMNKTRKGHDKKIQAIRTQAGFYEAPLPQLIRGLWYIQIEANNWRLINSITTN